MDVSAIEVRENTQQRRFEIFVAGRRTGFADYRDDGATRVFTHTEIDPAHQGQGLAGRLTRFALDDARARGSMVAPRCSFVQAYIARHAAEHLDLVPPERRIEFDLPAA